ncbi:hypothetical protein L596_024949 [Steinernema carpocapsae]|uniref:Uncharacterized protein n=1 Tax=Steinernema carpocapsae TaxID=34508 RepID=A0A4U5M6E3_STECR|nr:hypothetical protein L596_024949 [Steinernema carpocapsae]
MEGASFARQSHLYCEPPERGFGESRGLREEERGDGEAGRGKGRSCVPKTRKLGRIRAQSGVFRVLARSDRSAS